MNNTKSSLMFLLSHYQYSFTYELKHERPDTRPSRGDVAVWPVKAAPRRSALIGPGKCR